MQLKEKSILSKVSVCKTWSPSYNSFYFLFVRPLSIEVFYTISTTITSSLVLDHSHINASLKACVMPTFLEEEKVYEQRKLKYLLISTTMTKLPRDLTVGSLSWSSNEPKLWLASIDKFPTLSRGWPPRSQDILNSTNCPTKKTNILYKPKTKPFPFWIWMQNQTITSDYLHELGALGSH